jgi:hypothetical protein
MRQVRRSLVESQFLYRDRSKRQEREGFFQLSSTLAAPTPGLTQAFGEGTTLRMNNRGVEEFMLVVVS